MMYGFRDKQTSVPAVHLLNMFDNELLKNMIEGIIDKIPAEPGLHSEKGITGFETEKRTSTVRWFMDAGFESILRSAIDIANYNAGWRYDITKSELLQFTEYEVGGHYDWHRDGYCDHLSARKWVVDGGPKDLRQTNDPQLLGTVRKISASVILNDDYEGGEMEFKTVNDDGEFEITNIKPKTGSVIVFPSYVHHRVKPVTKGTRYSVVAWYGGPPFK